MAASCHRCSAKSAVARRLSSPSLPGVPLDLLDRQLADPVGHATTSSAAFARVTPACAYRETGRQGVPPPSGRPARQQATGSPSPTANCLGATRADSLKRLKGALASVVHRRPIPETGEDLDQPLRVLVHASTRSVCRLKLGLIHIRCDKRRHVTGRPQPEMHDVRAQARMPHERRMKLKRQIRPGDHRMDRQDVRTRPRARRLALSKRAIDREIEINPRSRVHISTVPPASVALAWRRSSQTGSDRAHPCCLTCQHKRRNGRSTPVASPPYPRIGRPPRVCAESHVRTRKRVRAGTSPDVVKQSCDAPRSGHSYVAKAIVRSGRGAGRIQSCRSRRRALASVRTRRHADPDIASEITTKRPSAVRAIRPASSTAPDAGSAVRAGVGGASMSRSGSAPPKSAAAVSPVRDLRSVSNPNRRFA